MINVIQDVMEHRLIKSVVARRAYIISQRFPNSFNYEDAKQELWEAVVKAVDKYNSQGELIQYVATQVYLRYAAITNRPVYNRFTWYETELPFEGPFFRNTKADGTFSYLYPEETHSFSHLLGEIDDSFEKVEANILLDNIEKTLKKESEKSTMYQVALDWFKLLRKDYSTKEASKSLNVSENYLNVIRHRVFKNLVRNYPNLQI